MFSMSNLSLIICSCLLLIIQGRKLLSDNVLQSAQVAAKLINIIEETPEALGIVSLNQGGMEAVISTRPSTTQNFQTSTFADQLMQDQPEDVVGQHKSNINSCSTNLCQELHRLRMCTSSQFKYTMWCQNIKQSAHTRGSYWTTYNQSKEQDDYNMIQDDLIQSTYNLPQLQ